MERVPRKARVFTIAVAGLAVAFLLVLVAQSPKWPWTAFFFFALLVFAVENTTVELPKVGAFSVGFGVISAIVILFGPVMAAASTIFTSVVWRDLKKHTSPYRWVFNGAQISLASGLAGLAYKWTGGPILWELGRGFQRADFPGAAVSLFLACIVFFLVNTTALSVVFSFVENVSPFRVWLVDFKWMILNFFALAPLGLALAQVYMTVGAPGMLLLLLALMIMRQTFKIYMDQQAAFEGTVHSLVAAIEAKDTYTKGHSERVAEYSERIARQLGIREDDVKMLRYAALLHDIGKIGVSRQILSKPTVLDDPEYDVVKEHPQTGARILSGIRFLDDAVPAIFHHHERFDGEGYVKGLMGKDIPLMARILAVADSYDAMTSLRPYRAAKTPEEAAGELKRCCGTQFDDSVVRALLVSLGIATEAPQSTDGGEQTTLDDATTV